MERRSFIMTLLVATPLGKLLRGSSPIEGRHFTATIVDDPTGMLATPQVEGATVVYSNSYKITKEMMEDDGYHFLSEDFNEKLGRWIAHHRDRTLLGDSGDTDVQVPESQPGSLDCGHDSEE